jgi:hypothetical protein
VRAAELGAVGAVQRSALLTARVELRRLRVTLHAWRADSTARPNDDATMRLSSAFGRGQPLELASRGWSAGRVTSGWPAALVRERMHDEVCVALRLVAAADVSAEDDAIDGRRVERTRIDEPTPVDVRLLADAPGGPLDEPIAADELPSADKCHEADVASPADELCPADEALSADEPRLPHSRHPAGERFPVDEASPPDHPLPTCSAPGPAACVSAARERYRRAHDRAMRKAGLCSRTSRPYVPNLRAVHRASSSKSSPATAASV